MSEHTCSAPCCCWALRDSLATCVFYPHVRRLCYFLTISLLLFPGALDLHWSKLHLPAAPTPPNLSSQPLYPWPALAAAFVCPICSLCIIDLALSCFGEATFLCGWTHGGVAVFKQCIDLGFLSGKAVGCPSWRFLFFVRWSKMDSGDPNSPESDSVDALLGPNTHQAGNTPNIVSCSQHVSDWCSFTGVTLFISCVHLPCVHSCQKISS